MLSRAQPLTLDCGAGVRLLAHHSAQALNRRATDGRRLALLLHGWEGSLDSPYVLSAAALLYQNGFDLVRLNLRDHGATQALNRDLFHSCRLAEVVGAVADIAARFPAARLYLGGFSLGGNFLLRVAAESSAPSSIAGVVAISPVLEPSATLLALEQTIPVYRRYFVRRWTRSLRAKQRAWPDVHDFEEVAKSGDLRHMTAELVRHHTDFADLDAYLSGYAITGERLASLQMPARILLANDDPIIPVTDLSRLALNDRITVVRTRFGGHCGFVDSWGRPSFADRFMLEQFEQFEHLATSRSTQQRR